MCSTYILVLGSLAEDHELGIGEELSRKVYFHSGRLSVNRKKTSDGSSCRVCCVRVD